MEETPEQSGVFLSHTVQIHLQSPRSDSQNSTTDQPGLGEQEHSRDCAPVGAEPAQEGSLDSGSVSTEMVLISLRKQQLEDRRAVLQNVQQFRMRAREAVGSTEGDEDGNQPCELETINEELKELAQREEDLQGQEQRNTVFAELTPEKANELRVVPCPGIYVLPSRSIAISASGNLMARNGGIYILPPAAEKEVEPDPEDPAEGQVTELENLGGTPAVVKCSSCEEVITTETERKVGPSMWILCGICTMFGCVAGCCLIPFFMDSMRDVQHQCPRCHTLIHTFQRL